MNDAYMSSYVHHCETCHFLKGSFRDFLDSVSVEISEKKKRKELTLDFFFQPFNNRYSLKLIACIVYPRRGRGGGGS